MTESEQAHTAAPSFSAHERDRRWSSVRAIMARDGFDVVICLPCSSNHNRAAGSSIYLTQLGEDGNEVAVYFPLTGEPTAFAADALPSDWLVDIRPLEAASGAQLVARLREAGFRRGTIGVAGLACGVYAHCREVEGEANWRSVKLIRDAFPDAAIRSASDLVGEARWVKSDEEIAVLREGSALCDAIHESVTKVAGVGVPERRVFAQMMYTSALLGSTAIPMLGWTSGPQDALRHRVEQPTTRILENGDALLVEIEGRRSGYIAQIDSLFTIGNTLPMTRDAFALAVESFMRVADRMRPGVTVGELVAAGRVESLGGAMVASLTMHGRGTGDDGPLVLDLSHVSLPQSMLDLQMSENAVLCVKPAVRVEGAGMVARFGDNVVVTRNGGMRLSSRPPRIAECV